MGFFAIFLSMSFNELQSRAEEKRRRRRGAGKEKSARAPGSGTDGKPDWHIDCSRGRGTG